MNPKSAGRGGEPQWDAIPSEKETVERVHLCTGEQTLTSDREGSRRESCHARMVLTSVRQVMTAATVFSPVVAKLTRVACKER